MKTQNALNSSSGLPSHLIPVRTHEVKNLPSSFRLSIEMNELLLKDSELNLVRINKMIVDLLHRPELAQVMPAHLSVYQLLDEVMAAAQNHFYLKHVEIVKGEEEDCTVPGNKAYIVIALTNIVIRAIDSMNAATSLLKLTATYHQYKYMIKIEDHICVNSGSPLRSVYKARFTCRDENGGRGLSMMLDIQKQNNVDLATEGVTPQGSCFTLSF
jgi:hypothetical protein